MKIELLQAYTETHYIVQGELSFVLRIGEASDLLRTCHSNSGVDCSAFVTACNPLGKKLPAQENALRHIALLAEIKKRSLFFLPGKSKHPTSKRAVEKSVLVLGLSLEATKVLGRRFEQNAVVWTGSDGVPVLVPLD